MLEAFDIVSDVNFNSNIDKLLCHILVDIVVDVSGVCSTVWSSGSLCNAVFA